MNSTKAVFLRALEPNSVKHGMYFGFCVKNIFGRVVLSWPEKHQSKVSEPSISQVQKY
jgi:hypothetical protein